MTEVYGKQPRTREQLAAMLLAEAHKLPGGQGIKRIGIQTIWAWPSLAEHSNWVWSFADQGPLPDKPTLDSMYARGRELMRTYYLTDAEGKPAVVPK